MTGLLWPGDHRAEDLFLGRRFVADLLRVESAWLGALAQAGVAPRSAAIELEQAVGPVDLPQLAVEAESGGNPVIPLLAVVRDRLGDHHPDATTWVHRGLTSQDTMDTAVVLSLRAGVDAVLAQVEAQVAALVDLAETHRAAVMAGRTLTQHAVPITFGLKAAQWLQGVLDARDDLQDARDRLPAQLGGAAGTLAGPDVLLSLTGGEEGGVALARAAAARLGLPWAPPWHTNRAPLTRTADALTRGTDAWGRIARDVLVLTRPETAEVAEPTERGRGGSSTMPHKVNPVLSTLIRRAALTAPNLAATMHLAAAEMVDERADGAWHTEWSTLSTLVRRAVTAASQTAELLAGLHVDIGAMARRADAAAPTLLAERQHLAGLVGEPPSDLDPTHYLGASNAIIDAIVARARQGGTR